VPRKQVPLLDVRKRLLAEYENRVGKTQPRPVVPRTRELNAPDKCVGHAANRSVLQKVIEDMEGRDLNVLVSTVEGRLYLRKQYHLDESTVYLWFKKLRSKGVRESSRSD